MNLPNYLAPAPPFNGEAHLFRMSMGDFASRVYRLTCHECGHREKLSEAAAVMSKETVYGLVWDLTLAHREAKKIEFELDAKWGTADRPISLDDFQETT